jgi:hypothetical protein
MQWFHATAANVSPHSLLSCVQTSMLSTASVDASFDRAFVSTN